MVRSLSFAAALALLVPAGGCGDAEPESADVTGAEEQPKYVALSPEQRLLRASMALRGTRPSIADYDAVAEDPGRFDALVDGYLQDPAFEATVQQHFTEWMELDQAPDVYPAGFPAVGDLAGVPTHALNTSIIEAAGRLAAHVVAEDRPWSEVVTADYTLADEIVATVWGLPYDWSRSGWQVTRYEDGRPLAGVLSDGWVFTRMPSTENNKNRERASLIADALICHDYPGRPVTIPDDIDLTDESAIANAIETNEVCVGCHQTLDPLANAFYSHYALRFPEYEYEYPLQQYTPGQAASAEPARWYGQPIEDIAELGRAIADDPRFSICAIRRFYSELMHVPVDDVPQEAIARLLPVFAESDSNVRELVRAIVTSDAFGAVAVRDGEVAPEPVGLRRATPQQLDVLIADLTGFQWRADVDQDLGGGRVGSVPLMRDYLWGYRTMAGGPNNFDTTTHIRTADPGTVLVLRALAERAARAAVARGALLSVPGATDGELNAVTEQLMALHLRLYGERVEPGDDALEQSEALFAAALGDSGDPTRAWRITLAAMLQDPAILFY
jgi:hypothetical protein